MGCLWPRSQVFAWRGLVLRLSLPVGRLELPVGKPSVALDSGHPPSTCAASGRPGAMHDRTCMPPLLIHARASHAMFGGWSFQKFRFACPSSTAQLLEFSRPGPRQCAEGRRSCCAGLRLSGPPSINVQAARRGVGRPGREMSGSWLCSTRASTRAVQAQSIARRWLSSLAGLY